MALFLFALFFHSFTLSHSHDPYSHSLSFSFFAFPSLSLSLVSLRFVTFLLFFLSLSLSPHAVVVVPKRQIIIFSWLIYLLFGCTAAAAAAVAAFLSPNNIVGSCPTMTHFVTASRKMRVDLVTEMSAYVVAYAWRSIFHYFFQFFFLSSVRKYSGPKRRWWRWKTYTITSPVKCCSCVLFVLPLKSHKLCGLYIRLQYELKFISLVVTHSLSLFRFFFSSSHSSVFVHPQLSHNANKIIVYLHTHA